MMPLLENLKNINVSHTVITNIDGSVYRPGSTGVKYDLQYSTVQYGQLKTLTCGSDD